MAITLNGSTGITSPGGDTSTSLSTGLLTVTGSTAPTNGMYLPTTNTLAWATNSTRNMTLDSSGNLGIGTSSPGSRLTVADGTTATLILRATTAIDTSNRVIGDLSFQEPEGTGDGTLAIEASVRGLRSGTDSFNSGGTLTFLTRPFNGTLAERARIDETGNLLIGTTVTPTSQTNSLSVANRIFCNVNAAGYQNVNSQTLQGTDGYGVFNHVNGTASGSLYIAFGYNGGGIGSITQNGTTAVLYNINSDQRLKENIVDAPSALSSINAIKVRSFDWKADGSHVDYGYIAQELLEVVPEAVSVPADPEEMMGVDFGRLTPRLVKAIQELTARLEALEGAK